MTADTASANPRIPVALQQIFVAAQRGEEVKEAPKFGLGMKIFIRPFTRHFTRRPKTPSMRPPSTSSLTTERSNTAADATRKAMQGKDPSKRLEDLESPQAYLDKKLQERGYSTRKFCSLEGGYYCRPTPLQQASYGSVLSQAIRASDASTLRKLLDVGLSPNPCNNYGESLVHMVCRRGDHKLLRVLLESGCSLQVTDDYGRTPLHDACWRAQPSFETVQLILDSDKHLLHLLDCRGAAPLSYVKKEHFKIWIEFLDSKIERFWPIRDVASEGEERPPPLTLRSPHSLPIPDPKHALPLEVASMVANGKIRPEEAMYIDDESTSESYSDDDDDDYSDSGSDYSDEDGSDDDDYSSASDDSFDQRELAELCLRAGGPMVVAHACFGKDVKVIGSPRSKTS